MHFTTADSLAVVVLDFRGCLLFEGVSCGFAFGLLDLVSLVGGIVVSLLITLFLILLRGA